MGAASASVSSALPHACLQQLVKGVVLMNTSAQVQESLLQIVAASTFAVIAAALESHVNEANRRGWTLPVQLAKGDPPSRPQVSLFMQDVGRFVMHAPLDSLKLSKAEAARLKGGHGS